MSGKTLKQHVLATTLSVLAVLIFCFATGAAQTNDERVQAALDAGHINDAIQILQDAIDADPSYYVNYYQLGGIYYDQEQWAKAAKQFEITLDRRSKSYEALYFLGRCQINLDQLDKAEKSLSLGLKKAKDLKAWFENGMGVLELKRGNYSDADIMFRRALAENESRQAKEIKDINNKKYTDEEREALIESTNARYARENAEYAINLGDANFYQGVPALAIAEYERALEIDTASTEVYYHWAEACLEIKDYNCAIEKLRVVLTKDSTHAPAWNRAGGIYYKAARSSRNREERKGRFIDAIGSYKKYFELTGAQPDSANVRAYFETAMAYASINGYEDAAEYFDKVLAIPFEPKDIYFYYGKSLCIVRDYVRAADMLKKHIDWVAAQDDDYQNRIDDGELYQLLGDSYFYRDPKDFSTAVRYYKKSLEDRPDQKRILQNTAVAFHSLKRYGEAIEFYDKRIALGIDSGSVGILKNAGLCALNIAGGASDDEDEDLEEFEEDAEPAAPIGVDPEKDYYEVAIDYMNGYLEIIPDDTTVILRVANTYLYQLQDCANGVSYFERLLTLTPDNCQAKKSLGYAYFGGVCNKDYGTALKYLRGAYDCLSAAEGGCADVSLVKWIAQCYHLRAAAATGDTNSDYKNAFDWYEKVLKCDPSDAEVQKARDEIRYEFN